ncbi:hypothetical protein ACWDAO_07605 [Streptomyces sp. NPDC001212]|uniref:hypothetical protein n=1 Tax=Streptomyces sp. HYC2 TaxID=2955207 RepID=UPI0024801399|nr:hypothetical protein [Streptomyces sp. HYC2]
MKLIVDHRRRLVRHPTATANKLRWFLHEIDPELPLLSGGLRRLRVFDALETALRGRSGVIVEITLDLIAECRRLTEQINAVEKRLRRLVQQLAPHLMAVPGCGVLGAAAILGETAGAARFKSKNCRVSDRVYQALLADEAAAALHEQHYTGPINMAA